MKIPSAILTAARVYMAKDDASPFVVTPDLPEKHPLAGARVVIMPVRW